MRLNEGSKIPLAVTCLALCAAAACSKKGGTDPEIGTIGDEIRSASMCSLDGLDVGIEAANPNVEIFVPPAAVEQKTVPAKKPRMTDKSISVGDLPVASWFDGTDYKDCRGLNPRKGADLQRMMADCKFYDPNGADGKGLPVLDLRGHYRDKLGPYFKVRDFARIDPNDLKYINPGHYETGEDGIAVHRFARISPAIVALMNDIRAEVGFPIFIDGGFRPFYHNVRMYRGYGNGDIKSKSRHVSGDAVDVDLDLTFKTLREKCDDPCFAKSGKGKKACSLKNKPVMSEHLFGTAYEIMQKRGGGGIGMGDTQMHFDTRNGGRVATWGYNSWNRKMIERLMKTPGRGRR